MGLHNFQVQTGKENDLKRFRETLERDFTLEELMTLCHDMAIPYENLGSSNTREGRVRELIQHCERHGRLLELLITTAKSRPRKSWRELWE